MIEAMLKREGFKLSRSTICHVLRKRRKGRISQRTRLKTHQKRYELVIPGQRLQMDVKYVPELVDGKRAYCYVILDECTRWRYCYIFDNLNAGTTVRFLEQFKRNCPFPVHTIQTDNGREFTYALNPITSHVKHEMDSWCENQGIKHRLIPPGVKELNGKVERSHRIDEQYFYWRASTVSLEKINDQLTRWIGFYNSQRLHGGLNYLTPLEKLRERRQTLQAPPCQPLPPELEKLRLRFIEQTPKSGTKQDWQLLKLEQELEALLKAA
jgi:transposase InsO family protein